MSLWEDYAVIFFSLPIFKLTKIIVLTLELSHGYRFFRIRVDISIVDDFFLN